MKLGRLELRLYRNEEVYPFLTYVSWCYSSESLFLGPYELIIQNRRNPSKALDSNT
jgi:hypothetical protein